MVAKLRPIILAAFCSMQPVYSMAATEQPATIPILIKPECKDMFYRLQILLIYNRNRKVKKRVREKPDYVPRGSQAGQAESVQRPSLLSISFMSDGRHLVAIDSEGRLLWVMNPTRTNPRFCQYRTPRPVIDYVAATEISPQLAAALKSMGRYTKPYISRDQI